MATNPRGIGELTLMIATEVRVQRAMLGIKQDALAQLADIPRPTLSRIERGLVAIDMEQLARLAQAFKMTPDAFVASARRNAEERAKRGEIYLPDGSIDPAVASTTPTSEEHAEALRRRKRS